MSTTKIYLPYKSAEILSGKIEFSVGGKRIYVPLELLKLLNSNNQNFVSKENVSSDGNVFRCRSCKESFSSDAEFQQHVQTHDFVKDEDLANQHVDNSFKRKKNASIKKKITCKLCNKSYCSKKTFQNHLTKAHGSISLFENETSAEESNEINDTLFQSINSDSANIENSVNNENAFPFSTCKKKFSSDAKLRIHSKIHNLIRDENIADKLCTDSFVKNNQLVKDHEISAKKKTVTCVFCGKSYCNKYTYHTHLKSVHNYVSVLKQKTVVDTKQHNKHPAENLLDDMKKSINRKIACGVCKKTFCRISKFQEHIASQHSTVSYESSSASGSQEDIIKNAMKEKIEKWQASVTCEICNSFFTSKYKLSIHRLVHTGEEPVKCTLCNKSFSSKQRMLSHYRLHEAVKSFSCNICFKLFRRTYDLDRHVHVHGSDRSFFCPICARSFTRKHYCDKHVVRHCGLKPYTCDICNKSFAEVGHLLTHKLIHSNERKHICEICNKSFKLISTLRDHYKCHSGDKKSYTCELCSRSYINRLSYKAHLFMHTGERPYSCEICNKGFVRKGSLNKHYRACVK